MDVRTSLLGIHYVVYQQREHEDGRKSYRQAGSWLGEL